MTELHGTGSGRVHRLTARLVDARSRYAAARRTGDADGAAYALAEVRRLRHVLAEG